MRAMKTWAAAAAMAAGTSLTAVSASAILPYNPTTLFRAPNDDNIIYILRPPSIGDVGTGYTGGLVKLNISESVNASSIAQLKVDNGLPLYRGGTEGGGTDAYAPWIAQDGTIGVYAGNCDPAGSAEPDTHSSLWIRPPTAATEDAGSWIEAADSISPSPALLSSGASYEANYLSSSFHFSTTVPGTATSGDIYTFGGMCPWRGSSGQNKANYTNTLLKLSKSADSNAYTVSPAGITSLKPVPEAGFTMTGLTPTISNSSSGQITQAQAFVLIGGHTQGAFIGMSQVAVFSLPQEVWTFQAVEAAAQYTTADPVVPPGSADGRDLAVAPRDGEWKSVPDSRSGHTAVLSSDGSKIIIFGGWVGDIETPAKPQLAVLYLGSGFGGEGEWRWEVPTTNGTGLAEGEGVFGHGAVMLPGDVVMFVGGYKISAASSAAKRTDEAAGMEVLFLNTTTMAFLDSYTNPAYVIPQSDDPAAPGYTPDEASSAHTNSKRVGIGAGIGIGLTAILGAIALYFWYRRKLTRRQTLSREKDLAQLSQSAHWDESTAGEMQQRMGSGSIRYSHPGYGPGSGNGHGDLGYAAPGAAYGPIEYQGYDHGHVEDSSISYVQPQNPAYHNNFTIPRKPPNARNARGFYQPTPPVVGNNGYANFDFGAAGGHSRTNSLGTAGAIHPIYEQDEEDFIAGEITDSRLIGVAHGDDPFVDPSPSASPTRSEGRLQLQLPPQPQSHEVLEPPPKSPLRDAGKSPRLQLTQSQQREEEKMEKHREVQDWVADWAAADAYAMGRTASTLNHYNPSLARHPSTSQPGRLSPNKTDTNSYSGRTDSNLSDQSAITLSLSRNDSTSTRTKSLTAFFQSTSGWGLFGGAANAPTQGYAAASRRPEIVQAAYRGPESGRATAESYYGSGSISPGGSERSNTLTTVAVAVAGQGQGQGQLKPPRSAGSGSLHSSNGQGSSGNSYMTAHSQLSAGFLGLKEQAETLLPRYGTWEGKEPGSPSKTKGRARKGSMGWLGSIKKVLGREEWVGSPGTEVGEGRPGEGDGEAYATYADSPSPTRINFGGEDLYSGEGIGGAGTSFPQRTASVGAQPNLWRRKQGRGDWGDSEIGGHRGAAVGGVHRSFTAAPAMGGHAREAEGEGEEEWDVEKAVRGRQVQVMFTVPKERLRVVNGGVSDEESEAGVVRGSSNRSAGSTFSARGRRGARVGSGEGARGRVPSREAPVQRQVDLLTGSPTRSPVRGNTEAAQEHSTPRSPKGKETPHDVPSLQPLTIPIRHLPPPRDQTPSPTPTARLAPLTISKRTREESVPKTPTSTVRSDIQTPSPSSRPVSPSKSLRSIRSGRVLDRVREMEGK